MGMKRGELRFGAQEEVVAHMQELLKRGEAYFDTSTTCLVVLKGSARFVEGGCRPVEGKPRHLKPGAPASRDVGM